MGGSKTLWLAPTAVLGAACWLACGSFSGDDTPATAPPLEGGSGGDDGGAPPIDAAAVDASDGAPSSSCAVPELGFDDSFDSPNLKLGWTPAGAEPVQSGAQAPNDPNRKVLLATATIPDGGNSGAYLYHSIPVAKLPRTIDVRYALLFAPNGYYSDVGCTLHFEAPSKGLFTGMIFAKTTGNVVRFGVGDYGTSTTDGPVHDFMSVSGAARWYSVALHVDIADTNDAEATVTITDPSNGSNVSGLLTKASGKAFKILDGVDKVELFCGLAYAGYPNGPCSATDCPGSTTIALDDLDMKVCPR